MRADRGNDDSAAPAERGNRLSLALRGQTWLRVRGRRFVRSVAAGKRPPAEREVRIVGLDPVRILLAGGDYSLGTGAETRSAAVDGALARLVHEQTGRGVIVVNRAREDLRLRDAAAALGPNAAHTFHVVVWTPPFREATRSVGARIWRTEIARMVERAHATSAAGVVVLGIPALAGRQPIALIARARATWINRAIRAGAETGARSVYVDAPSLHLGELQDADAAVVYRDVAVRILPAVLHVLPGRRRQSPASSSVVSGRVEAPTTS